MCYNIVSVLCFGFFFLRGMWDLSSLTRDQTRILCIRRQSLNHWRTKEVPNMDFLCPVVCVCVCVCVVALLLLLDCELIDNGDQDSSLLLTKSAPRKKIFKKKQVQLMKKIFLKLLFVLRNNFLGSFLPSIISQLVLPSKQCRKWRLLRVTSQMPT